MTIKTVVCVLLLCLAACQRDWTTGPTQATCATANLRDNPEMFRQKNDM